MASEAWSATHQRIIKTGRVWRFRYADALRLSIRCNSSGGGRRGHVVNFSRASARRFRFAFETRPENFSQFVTLTFPRELFTQHSVTMGRLILKQFVREYWQEARKIDAKYLWVAEPQKDGTPHYHVLVTGHGEQFAELWRRLVYLHLGYKHEAHEVHGTDVRPITQDGINRYLAKTCYYVCKSAGEAGDYYLIGWRRWGRNYVSKPWAIEYASERDLAFGVYASALGRRPNALSTLCIFDTGVLEGSATEVNDIEAIDEVPNQFLCQLSSGASLSPY